MNRPLSYLVYVMKSAKPPKPKYFDQLLVERPATPLLDSIHYPSDLKGFEAEQLTELCDELRAFLLYSVPLSGGHFGANLGTVELTVALHYVLNTPTDKLVWDVGHQAYAHKILTGRKDKMASIRAKDGLTAFPERRESEYDSFGVGHSSTAISAGLGMSLAARLADENITVACVVGDGAMTGGMAFEAMNDAVQQNADLMVILNDNDMSISQATGGFSKHLAQLWQRGLAVDIDKAGSPIITKRNIASDDRRIRHYLHMANDAIGDLSVRIPAKVAQKLAQGLPTPSDVMMLPEKLAGKIADNVFPDNLFRAIGFSYFGPFDGHDVVKLTQVLERTKALKGAVLIHIHTVKGKGFGLAENDPIGYHALSKLPPKMPDVKMPDVKISDVITDAQTPKSKPKKYSEVFGQFLLDKAQNDSRLVAITPAMAEGSGMTKFASVYPARFFDVAIAEQHAVTLAAGMATNPTIKPIVAIYSTFLQRGYDQLIHDVALQNLDVTFAIDRAGLVGEDGATHAGVFDLAFMRCVPNMVIAVPSDENECYQLLNACYEYSGASAVRYPRGAGVGAKILPFNKDDYPIGRAVLSQIYHPTPPNTNAQTAAQADNPADNHQSPSVVMLVFGTLLSSAKDVAKRLCQDGVLVSVYDMRFVKPLDCEVLDALACDLVVTIEEHQRMGGAGSAVNEYVLNHLAKPPKIINMAIDDVFIAHASHAEQLVMAGLDGDGIYHKIKTALSHL